MARKKIVLHSALAPERAVETLRREMDEERWSLFTLSGLAGDRPVVGKIEGDRLRLRKRVYLHTNDFAGQFYGRMTAERSGTRIEGYFDFPLWIRYLMWGWLALAAVICVPIFAAVIFDLALGAHFIGGGANWLGLVVAPAFLIYALLLPKVGRYLGRGGERYILHFMETKLAARMEGVADFEQHTSGGL